MWPWTKPTTEARQPVEPNKPTATDAVNRAELVARLVDLEERTAQIERMVKGIDTDWSEWFDKFRRLYARIAKRQERDDAGAQSAQDAPESTNDDPGYLHPSPHFSGTAHLSRRFRGL